MEYALVVVNLVDVVNVAWFASVAHDFLSRPAARRSTFIPQVSSAADTTRKTTDRHIRGDNSSCVQQQIVADEVELILIATDIQTGCFYRRHQPIRSD